MIRRPVFSGTVILGVLVLFPILLTASPPGKTRAEKSLLKKIATEWINLGRWCAARKLATQGKECLERAESADPESKSLAGSEYRRDEGRETLRETLHPRYSGNRPGG
ncbi:MAG: hypothetical protein ACYTHM_13455 [Planctomycetota bacterium]